MTSATISSLRLSMIWTSPVRVPAATAIAPLADDAAYEQVFAAAQAAPARFAPPWPPVSGALFWTYYLSRKAATADGATCRRHLVPVRERLPAVATSLAGVRLVLEGFYAHTGIAVVLSAQLTAPLDSPLGAGDVIDRATALRRDQVLDTAAGVQRADEVAAGALARLTAEVTGTALPPGTLPDPVFSIATVVQLDGLCEPTAVAQGDERHRFVDALAHLDHDWRTTVLPDLATRRLDTKQAPASHLLYARNRARTVWYPTHARAGTDHPTRLSCYHRNLTFASLQTELLLGYSAKISQLGQAPSVRESDDLGRAQRMLQRLYGRTSYRSGSVLAQITARKDEVNQARLALGLDPL
jgi:hypothetical protein